MREATQRVRQLVQQLVRQLVRQLYRVQTPIKSFGLPRQFNGLIVWRLWRLGLGLSASSAPTVGDAEAATLLSMAVGERKVVQMHGTQLQMTRIR